MSAWVKLTTSGLVQMVNLDRFDQVWVEKAKFTGDGYELNIRSAETGTKTYFFAPGGSSDQELAQRWKQLADATGIPSFAGAPLFN
jgi:hypothetical protein